MLTEQKDIENFFRSYEKLGYFEFTTEGVNVKKSFCISENYLIDGKLPCQFNECLSFDIELCDGQLKSLRGCPRKVKNRFSISGRYDDKASNYTKINFDLENNFEFLPKICERMDLSCVKGLKTFSGIEKVLTHCRFLSIPQDKEVPLLSALKIPGLENIFLQTKHRDAENMINEYLNNKKGSILQLQKGLIAAGYKEYAKL
jgi:hypothetical protein